MQYTVTATQKWQVHIPTGVRSHLGMTRPTKMTMEVLDDKIIITPPKTSILDLAGSLKTKSLKLPPIDKIRDHIEYDDI